MYNDPQIALSWTERDLFTTVPPEPLGCRQWRAFRDPEGLQGYGDTEQAAIDNFRELLCTSEE